MFAKKLKIRTLLIAGILVTTMVGCQNKHASSLNISAASSLTESVTEVSNLFKEEHKETSVNLNFGASSTLKTQILEGADVDVFLSANKKQYQELLDQGYIAEGTQFATNHLVLVTQKDNQEIQEFEALDEKGISLLLANEEVPVGKYALEIIENADKVYQNNFKENVLNNVISKEANVRQVLSKVVLGEADCGIVYSTDITKDVKDNVRVIEIPDDINVKGEYWIGLIKKEHVQDQGKAFYDKILSNEGQRVLKEYGFE